MKIKYYKYQEKYTYNGEQYELHSIISGDEEVAKPKVKLLNMQELVNRKNVGDLIVNVYIKYTHSNDSYETLGYEICE